MKYVKWILFIIHEIIWIPWLIDTIGIFIVREFCIFMVLFPLFLINSSSDSSSFVEEFINALFDDSTSDVHPFMDADNGKANHTETHADWVQRDAEKNRKISEQYDRDWALDYLDEHEI